jgi:lipoprotein signal peptidase
MAILLVVAILADRILKVLIGMRPDFYQPILGNHLTLQHALNVHGPLGINLPSGLLFGLAFVVLISLVVLIYIETNYTYRILLLTVFVGVFSNTLDRLSVGYVIDVFRITPGLIFNVADLMIVIGVVTLLVKRFYESGR